ncbi:MAG: tyrosine-protein phosphatase [Rikenellaceae bacterium]|jgi:hypothetical protein|nr:tyrosine-protein phosphatase [Rikenellaceae bacterium]
MTAARYIRSISLLALLCIALTACGQHPAAEVRKPQWATPVAARHVENLYLVDTGVYRCGQPSAEGFKELYELGVREILNLRNHHGDESKAAGVPLVLHRIKMNAGDSQTDRFVEALRIIRDRRGPIAIHCWHGSDRTGAVVALYRIAFQDWTPAEALDELMNGGYGYHTYYKNIPAYFRTIDPADLKARVFGDAVQ